MELFKKAIAEMIGTCVLVIMGCGVAVVTGCQGSDGLIAILGVTSKTENGTVAGIVIGLVLTLVHLLGIRLTGTSVNPARSIGPALLALANGATEPIKEIWIFIVGPFAGAALAGLVFNKLLAPKAAPAAK